MRPPPAWRGSRHRSVPAGFGSMVECPLRIRLQARRYRQRATCRLASEKNWPCYSCRGLACARAHGSWGAHPRRFPESSDEMRHRDAATSLIGRRRRSGTRTGPRLDRRRRDWSGMTRCVFTWPTGSRVTWSRRAAARWSALRCGGMREATVPDSIGGECRRGVRSRLHIGCRSTFRTIPPSVSVTRPSTKRCISKGVARCVAS